MAGIIGLAQDVFQTIGVAGVAAFWGLKLGMTMIFFRVYQKKTGCQSPVIPGWVYRQALKRRIENGTNGH